MKNGDILSGTVIQENSEVLQIKNVNIGSLILKKIDIEKVTPVQNKDFSVKEQERTSSPGQEIYRWVTINLAVIPKIRI